jgi:hypothetical protein
VACHYCVTDLVEIRGKSASRSHQNDLSDSAGIQMTLVGLL